MYSKFTYENMWIPSSLKRRCSEPTISTNVKDKDASPNKTKCFSLTKLCSQNDETRPKLCIGTQVSRVISCPLPNNQLTFRRKISTEKTTLILISIVVLFLLTHSYRLAIKFYEALIPHSNTEDSFEQCYSLGR